MHQKELEIELLSWKVLEEVPSASGLVKFKDNFYAIGDDSPYLFCLDKDFNLLSKSLIYSDKKLQGNTIPKKVKPDFEAMEMISETEILVFGSGSKSPERDVCVKVEMGEEISYTAYDISSFYDYIRRLDSMQGYELDIEGLAFQNDLLYLLNRGRNIIFSFSLQEFLLYCETGENFPQPQTQLFSLPDIEGLEAGFSGATIYKHFPYLLFTASVEDSPNSYDDGDVLGSFIGIIEIENGELKDKLLIEKIPNPGFPLKVESVIVDKVISTNEIDLVLVTDNDGALSEVLKVRMTVR